MGKSWIKISCKDQVLKITEAPVVAAGGLNEVYIEFTFCQKWDGFAKTATFYRDEEEAYYAVLDENDTCIVPWEVCFESGTFYIGVFGVKDEIRRTTNVVKYKVRKGAITENMIPSNPSPQVYEQIMSEIGKIAYIRACNYSVEINEAGVLTYSLDDSPFTGGDPKVGDLFVTANGFVCHVDDASYGDTDATIQYSLVANIKGDPGTIDTSDFYTKDSPPTAAEVGARPNTWTPTAHEIGAVPKEIKVNNKQLSGDIIIDASDVNAVPVTRVINGKELSSDITLSASDVGARPNNWIPTASEVGALPKSGGTMTGNLDMDKKRVTNVAEPTEDADAVPKQYVDNRTLVASDPNNDGHVVLSYGAVIDGSLPSAEGVNF